MTTNPKRFFSHPNNNHPFVAAPEKGRYHKRIKEKIIDTIARLSTFLAGFSPARFNNSNNNNHPFIASPQKGRYHKRMIYTKIRNKSTHLTHHKINFRINPD